MDGYVKRERGRGDDDGRRAKEGGELAVRCAGRGGSGVG